MGINNQDCELDEPMCPYNIGDEWWGPKSQVD